MSCLWISLSVLCAASVLQSSASPNKEMSNPAVSLKCNQTVGVTAGKVVTLTCVMSQWNSSTLKDCEGVLYSWRNTRGKIPCNNGSMKYNCKWDNLTSVSLTISNVMEDDNYKISILMTCGMAESSIKVQVKPNTNGTIGKPQDPEEDTNPYVSQDPPSISRLRVNSSAEITCSTSLSDPMGVYLHRGFHDNRDVVFLDLVDREVKMTTIAAEFTGRIHIAPDQQRGEGYGFTMQLSLLGLEDTDWYYCTWMYFNLETAVKETLSSKGRIIIVRERDPQEHCSNNSWDLIFIALSVTACTVVLLLLIGALIVRCTRFKKDFRPARAVKASRPNRPQQCDQSIMTQ